MRLIDADFLSERVSEQLEGLDEFTRDLLTHFIHLLDMAPTVDVVDAVRCQDCKWCDTRTSVCHNPRFGDGWANYPPPSVREDFFCTDGERKDDG